MTMQSLLSELSERGIKLRLAENQQLSVIAPKGQLSDSLLAQIRINKDEMVRWLALDAVEQPVMSLPTIEPDREGLHEPFPMADLQTAFLMGERAEMEHYVRPHYYVEMEHEDFDVTRFERAVNVALDRQAANLPVSTEDLDLIVPREHAQIEIPVDDLRGLSDELTNQALLATRERMKRQTLPLDRWPWLDFRISLYGQGRARLHYNNNNFFSDGYGTTKLLANVMRCYEAPETTLPPLSLSFRDCARALHEIERSPLGEAAKKYWLDRVPNLPPSLNLPARPGFNPRTRSMLERRDALLSAPLWSAFKQRAGEYGLTPTNALYAVYAELLSHFGGSRHFLLNNMVTHRMPIHPEITEIIGNFASLYPLEVDWQKDEPFFERARRLQLQLTQDLERVHYSGVLVLQALNQAQRTPGRAVCPLVVGSGLFMGPTKRSFYSTLETPQVTLDHQFWETPDGELWFVWDLIEAAFPKGFVDGMWQSYSQLLSMFAVSKLAWTTKQSDVLPAAERDVRERTNATQATYLPELLHASLLQPVRAEASALVSSSARLSYDELARQAAVVARHLRAAGVEAGSCVPVVLEKGIAQIVAVYAVLLAGAAYVPVDPSWPSERLRWIAAHVQAPCVLSTREVFDKAGLRPDLELVFSSSEEPALSHAGEPVASEPRSADDLCYIIFTSGSTGTPKGVAMSHSAVMNTVVDVNRRFRVNERDTLFGISSLSFDLSVYDIFGAARAGARLVLPTGDEVGDPEAWLRLLRTHQVTVWNSAPALMQLLVDAAETHSVTLPDLRLVLLSGDWIPVGLPERIRRVAPGAEVISLGGATEAAIWSIFYAINRVEADWLSVPYGKPLANQTWHVLDDRGADVPAWVPGHLYIGGSGLALGYFRDAERTAASFVAHPQTGERLYRTGDLGRYLPDGNIELLGRSDFQVKIQGYRVELGEIEHAIAAYPGVAAAAVLAVSSVGGKVLVAFVVPQGDSELSPSAIAEHVRARLPSYMVPSSVQLIPQLPLSPNGKVDRRALEQQAAPAEAKSREYVPARNPTDQALLEIWEEVLGITGVGIHDDFFDLGGQSLAALRVMTRISKRFSRSLPLGAMLRGRTVAALATILNEGGAWSPLVRLAAGGGTPWCFVHPAGGNVLCYRALAKALGVKFMALQAEAVPAGQEYQVGIEELARRYVQALRAELPDGPYILGGWSSGGTIAFEMARQLAEAGQSVPKIVLLDTPSPAVGESLSERTLLNWFVEDLHLGVSAEQVAQVELMPDWPVDAWLAKVLQELEIGTQTLDYEQLTGIFRIFRRTVAGCRAYAGAPIDSDLLLLRARDGRVSEFAHHPAATDPAWGWEKFTRGGISVLPVPGSHHTILDEANLSAVLACLRL